MKGVRLTHIGGPTVLIETGGWRLLVDPTFDAPGRRYAFGWGTSSRKTTGPALAPDAVLPIDVVLLSHDHHADNLDDAGRALLPSAGVVVTTTGTEASRSRPASSRLSAWWSWLSSTASTGSTSAAATAGPRTLREPVPQPNA